jgi:SET domain
MYAIEHITGKGKGLIARQDIERGTRILSERPLITITSFATDMSSLNRMVAEKLGTCTKDEQRAFLDLHNSHPGPHPFAGIFKTNALPLGPDSPYGGIFLEISRINHACLANTQHTWNAQTHVETIHAVRAIAPGEEITIMYADGPSTERRQRLKSKFGFDCICVLCSLPLLEKRQSDARLVAMEALDAQIGDPIQMHIDPASSLAAARYMLALLEAEGIADARLPRLYYDAFQIVVAHGDLARAKVFASKAYEARRTVEGDDSPEVMKVKELSQNPSKHPVCQALSSRWRLALKKTPVGLSEEELAAWLWERAAGEPVF